MNMETITINTEYIKLDQLLKFSGIAEDGADAKFIINQGIIYMGEEVILQRGKKLYPGDIITIRTDDENIDIKVIRE